jgi:sugar lactone lactonase YvrE
MLINKVINIKTTNVYNRKELEVKMSRKIWNEVFNWRKGGLFKSIFGLGLTTVSLTTSLASATTYTELTSWSTISNGGNSTSHFAAVVDGQTSYHQLALGSSPRIVKVTNLNGTQTQRELVSTAQWGSTSLTSFYGFSVSGDYIQFSDISSDAVWRVNKDTGAITEYIAKATIGNYLGIATSSVALTSPSDTTPTGEFVFYESSTKNILITNGANTVSTLLSQSQLASAEGVSNGSASVSGGFTFDGQGSFYWGDSNKGIYKLKTDGTTQQVLSVDTIKTLTGKTSVSFNDVYAAPDGNLYFRDNSSANVLQYSLANGTLISYLTQADLKAGPIGNVSGTLVVNQFSWYDGKLAFNVQGANGLYVVPEPATLILLGLGFFGFLKRKH